jgi:type II secretory pathway component PulM
MVSFATLLPLAAPALPLDEAGKYVAGAYVVFLVLIVVYVAIMAAKLQRIERELRELAGFAESRAAIDQAAPGRESDGSSISDSLTHYGSGGGGA